MLLGALIAAEKLIIQPIEMMAAMAKRFGQGDWSARVARKPLPAEFVPLARAFNAMAAQLGQRERELVATNDRLTVMASIDMLSGLANRRGFQSRLDFEWMKAQQYNSELSLLMIDVDHFKLFNDTYGHPEGDACLTRLGEALSGIAGETMGFAGRYGGEEFCLLLPNTDAKRALEIGEMVRAAVQNLALPHCHLQLPDRHRQRRRRLHTLPNDTQQPGDLIEAADAALYAAKHRGRNTVVEHGFVRLTDDGMALASHQSQHLIADTVPEIIIELLEVIDVDQQHAERLALFHRRDLGGAEELIEGTAVRQAGERVGLGALLGFVQRIANRVQLACRLDEARFQLGGAGGGFGQLVHQILDQEFWINPGFAFVGDFADGLHL